MSTSHLSGGHPTDDFMYCSSYIQGRYSTSSVAKSRSPDEICGTLFATVEKESSRLTPFDRVLAARTFKAAGTGEPQTRSHTLNKIFTEVFAKDVQVDPANLSDEALRTYLIEHGILPSPAEAKATFWALGDDWWKQIIDGNQHQHGKMVFDKGLHKGHKEPGYLEGIEKASRYFTDNFDQPFSLHLYQFIHAKACEHFKQAEGDGTQCSGNLIHLFRFDPDKYFYPDKLQFKRETEELNTLKVLSGYADYYLNHNADKAKFMDLLADNGESVRELTPSEISLAIWQKQLELRQNLAINKQNTVDALKQETDRIVQRLSLGEPFIRCNVTDDGLSFIYLKVNCKVITEKLIEEFNRDLTQLQRKAVVGIQKLNSKDSQQKVSGLVEIQKEYQEGAVKLIARLYSGLEWLHPWIDGQGRTDLILLNGLLCREGLHPSILNHPYFSTVNTVEKWIDYLKDGLIEYEKLRTA